MSRRESDALVQSASPVDDARAAAPSRAGPNGQPGGRGDVPELPSRRARSRRGGPPGAPPDSRRGGAGGPSGRQRRSPRPIPPADVQSFTDPQASDDRRDGPQAWSVCIDHANGRVRKGRAGVSRESFAGHDGRRDLHLLLSPQAGHLGSLSPRPNASTRNSIIPTNGRSTIRGA